ncbi:hypothetical protein APED_01615 [Acanthopleuribacter pedis]
MRLRGFSFRGAAIRLRLSCYADRSDPRMVGPLCRFSVVTIVLTGISKPRNESLRERRARLSRASTKLTG